MLSGVMGMSPAISETWIAVGRWVTSPKEKVKQPALGGSARAPAATNSMNSTRSSDPVFFKMALCH